MIIETPKAKPAETISYNIQNHSIEKIIDVISFWKGRAIEIGCNSHVISNLSYKFKNNSQFLTFPVDKNLKSQCGHMECKIEKMKASIYVEDEQISSITLTINGKNLDNHTDFRMFIKVQKYPKNKIKVNYTENNLAEANPILAQKISKTNENNNFGGMQSGFLINNSQNNEKPKNNKNSNFGGMQSGFLNNAKSQNNTKSKNNENSNFGGMKIGFFNNPKPQKKEKPQNNTTPQFVLKRDENGNYNIPSAYIPKFAKGGVISGKITSKEIRIYDENFILDTAKGILPEGWVLQ